MKEQIISEIKQLLTEAEQADGFFITITIRRGNELFHHRAYVDFFDVDLIPSLKQIITDIAMDPTSKPPLQLTTSRANA